MSARGHYWVNDSWVEPEATGWDKWAVAPGCHDRLRPGYKTVERANGNGRSRQ